ncbi:unnamed protein product [Lactuca saligna]|uniref:RRM domain-containing protein n=1 Tax=Lactuca saligna TaxID=75948 RepID=A0AA35YCD1_LACSI|nr:unnamed protein product [Lactuca saligna]
MDFGTSEKKLRERFRNKWESCNFLRANPPPPDWNEAPLWRMFNRFGTVFDVYIAKKLNRLNKNFGFVRFIRIQETISFEKRLNEIYIGAQKIEVNVARFERNENVNRRRNPQVTGSQRADPVMNPCLLGRSFVDAVRGTMSIANNGSGRTSKVDEGMTPTRKTIKMLSYLESKEAMQNTLVGEVENFQALMNVKAFQEEIWQPWFKEVTAWEVECNFNERIASLIIQGVPQHAWCEDTFSIIARTWGSVAIPEDCNIDSPNLAFRRVEILTSQLGIISSSITILVDGKPYQINVMEDIFESLKLSLMLAANDLYQRMSCWDEDSIGENGSLNSEVSVQSDDVLQSSEISLAKAYQSWQQDGEVEKSHVNISSSEAKESP